MSCLGIIIAASQWDYLIDTLFMAWIFKAKDFAVYSDSVRIRMETKILLSAVKGVTTDAALHSLDSGVL